MVHDDTTDFLSDFYSEMKEVPEDDEEDGEARRTIARKENRGLTMRIKM